MKTSVISDNVNFHFRINSIAMIYQKRYKGKIIHPLVAVFPIKSIHKSVLEAQHIYKNL